MSNAVKPALIDEIISSATRAERDTTICVAGHLNARIGVLEEQLAELHRAKVSGDSLDDVDPRVPVAREIEAVREQMRAHEHVFTMQGLGSKEWSDLTAAHPPREDQREKFNLTTFPAALVLASCVRIDGEPAELTDDQVSRLFDALNEGQRDDLFNTAWEANTGRVSVPFSGLASAILNHTAER